MSTQEIIDTLQLEPLAVCNGFFREAWRDEHCTVIYWLLPESHVAKMHMVRFPQVFTYHAGDPLEITLLHPGGRLVKLVLGPDLQAGQRPHVVVPADVWQAARPLGAYTLTSVVVSPPFSPEAITIADSEKLCADYPEHAAMLQELC